MSDRTPIAEMAPNARFSGTFSISNTQVGRTRTNKPYLRCILGDASATAPGRMWNADENLAARLPSAGFVYCEGETQPYEGQLQLIIQKIEATDPSPDQLRELLPSSERSGEAMFAEVTAILDTLAHPAAKALANEYLADEMLMANFKIAPAAKMMHHAYLGGLCEHTLSLLNLANAALPNYPKLNRDIVLLGLFLHDLGKTTELAYEGAFTYTERGELIGHIVEGAIMLHDKAQSAMRSQGVRFPADFVTVLQHIILSHHGVPEYGAAKLPSTPEALFVSMLDNLDAKIAVATEHARPSVQRATDMGGNFTEKIWALETKLFRPDPLATP